jgi:hypothetical protein
VSSSVSQGLMEVKKHSFVHVVKSEEHMVLQKRMEELSVQLAQIQEEKEQLQQEKVCLTVVHLAFRIEYAVLQEFMSTHRK